MLACISLSSGSYESRWLGGRQFIFSILPTDSSVNQHRLVEVVFLQVQGTWAEPLAFLGASNVVTSPVLETVCKGTEGETMMRPLGSSLSLLSTAGGHHSCSLLSWARSGLVL